MRREKMMLDTALYLHYWGRDRERNAVMHRLIRRVVKENPNGEQEEPSIEQSYQEEPQGGTSGSENVEDQFRTSPYWDPYE